MKYTSENVRSIARTRKHCKGTIGRSVEVTRLRSKLEKI